MLYLLQDGKGANRDGLQDGKGANRDGSQGSIRRIASGDGYRKPPKADESRGIDRGIGKRGLW
jgi:hypothetical protein